MNPKSQSNNFFKLRDVSGNSVTTPKANKHWTFRVQIVTPQTGKIVVVCARFPPDCVIYTATLWTGGRLVEEISRLQKHNGRFWWSDLIPKSKQVIGRPRHSEIIPFSHKPIGNGKQHKSWTKARISFDMQLLGILQLQIGSGTVPLSC